MQTTDDPAVAASLRTTHVAHVATVSPSGRPFVTPLWFVVDGGALYLTTALGSRAARNVVTTPEVTVLLTGDAGRSPEAIQLRGTASCHAGLPSWRVLLRVAAKYYAAPAALRCELAHAASWGLRARYHAGAKGGAGYLRVVPHAAARLARPS